LKFGAAPLDACEGAILAHSQMIGGRRLAKGRPLTGDDIAVARAGGLTELVVARLEDGDVREDDAAARLGAAIAGTGVTAQKPVHGRVNLLAVADGLVRLDPVAVDALNTIDESLTLGVRRPLERVVAGDIVATIKIIPYAVPRSALDTALAAAGRAGADFPQQVDRCDRDVIVGRGEVFAAHLGNHRDDDGGRGPDTEKLANGGAYIGVIDLAGRHQADARLRAAYRNDAPERGWLR